MTEKRFKHYLGGVIPFIKDNNTGKNYYFLSLCRKDIVTLTKLLNEFGDDFIFKTEEQLLEEEELEE